MVDNKLLERLESIENVLKKIGDQLEAAIRGKCEHHWSTIDGRCVRCGDRPPTDPDGHTQKKRPGILEAACDIRPGEAVYTKDGKAFTYCALNGHDFDMDNRRCRKCGITERDIIANG